MSYLIDTNVISELRKKDRCNPNVAAWFGEVADNDIFLSVLTVGELRCGVERIRRRDKAQASVLNKWIHELLVAFGERILPIDQVVAEEWGRLNFLSPLPVIDGLLAATTKVHGLTLITRNTKDIDRLRVNYFNPF